MELVDFVLLSTESIYRYLSLPYTFLGIVEHVSDVDVLVLCRVL